MFPNIGRWLRNTELVPISKLDFEKIIIDGSSRTPEPSKKKQKVIPDLRKTRKSMAPFQQLLVSQ